MTKKGKFIVIEGTDGSGKKTQLDLLRKNYRRIGQRFEVLDFPRYYSNFWGALIGRFLSGEFGDLDDVSPYLIAPFFAMDQASSREDVAGWRKEGKFILSNRYLSSSMAHQAARLSEDEQEAFLRWFLEAGYKWLKAEREDVVIVLYVPTEISYKLANDKRTRKRKRYINGKKEIAEGNYEHQEKSAEMYVKLAKRFDHWKLIKCVNRKGELKSIVDIQGEILKILADLDLYDGQLAIEGLENSVDLLHT